MPLDGPSAALASLVATWELPPLADATIAELRVRAEAKLMTLIAPGERVARVEDLRVPAADRELRLRAYRPRAGARAGPAVIFLHGGGWVSGSVEHCDALCRSLANRASCTVLSVDYRLAPEHPHPAALEDAYAALAWVARHARELDVDPERIGVCGESAGGNLAAALTLLAARREEPAVAFQLLLCPALDATLAQPSHDTYGRGHTLDRASLAWFWARYRQGAPATDPRVSPLWARLTRPLPPTAVVVAECDPLRDEALAYAARLAQAGTDVSVRCWSGQLHSFFLYTARLAAARLAADELGRELRRLLEVARR